MLSLPPPVLAAYLDDATRGGLLALGDIGCHPLEWPERVPAISPSDRRHPRGTRHAHAEAQGNYLGRLVARLDDVASDPDTAAYLDLLDRALEDRRLTSQEADALEATAREWGLDAAAVAVAHKAYLESVVEVALSDGVVTDAERDDLERVASLLHLPVAAITDALSSTPAPAPNDVAALGGESLTGKSVCFTGTLRGTLDGQIITRSVAQQLAREAGLDVRTNVTRDLDVLVVADPDSLSGKARRHAEPRNSAPGSLPRRSFGVRSVRSTPRYRPDPPAATRCHAQPSQCSRLSFAVVSQ